MVERCKIDTTNTCHFPGLIQALQYKVAGFS